jgi:hypothetical protein
MPIKVVKFNTGLRELLFRSPQDFIAGDYSPLVWEKRTDEEKGFWLSFVPVYEVQNDNGVDKMNCTTMATDNVIEIDIKKQAEEINISDRFVSVISGNTKDGNFVHYPIEAIMKKGFVLENEYPEEYKTPPPTWEEYYQDVPQGTLDKALEVLDKYSFDREFIDAVNDPDSLYQKLHEAPLKATVRYASSENPEDILNPKGKHNHDIVIVSARYGEYWVIFDSYAWLRGLPTLKKYAWNYQFGSVMRIKVELKNNNTNMIFKQNYPYLLVEGESQKLGFFLDGRMIIDDWVKILVQSASRLKRYEPAIPVKLVDFDSVPHANLKGELIE